MLRRARILEWVTLGYMASAVAVLGVVMGQSQTMKAAWAEDMLSLIPPAAFLISSHYCRRPPTKDFPYGYHRSTSIAFLVAALALLTMGLYLLIDNSIKLVRAEHPTIGSVELFGRPIWLGWVMLAALAYTGIPPVFLGRAKLGPAERLHDKTLHADATMNRADWMTVAAATLGVAGIGIGWWWADAVAALVISLDVIKDGLQNVRSVIADLMDREPHKVDHSGPDEVPGRLVEELGKLSWVAAADVRLRENGHVYFGEVFIVPHDDADPLGRIRQAGEIAKSTDWRVNDVSVELVERLGPRPA